MATFHDLTIAQLKQAVEIREQIEWPQQELDALVGGTAPKAKPDHPAAHRTKAAELGEVGAASAWHLAHVKSPLDTLFDPAPKKKGAITPEDRAKLSTAMKARRAARKQGTPKPNASANE